MLHLFIAPSPHPLFFINITLMLGVYSAFLGYSIVTAFILGMLLCGIALLYKNRMQHAFLFFIPLCFVIGSFRYHQQQNSFNYFQKQFVAQKCTLTGRINDIENTNNQQFRHKVTFTIHHLVKNDKKQHANYTVFIYTNKITDTQVSDIVTIPDIKLNKSNSPSFSRYLLKEGVCATSFIPELRRTLELRPSFSCTRFIHTTKTKLYKALQNKLSHTTFSLFSSLFFGKQQKQLTISQSMREECVEWGISHYLARSGLHLVICVMLWQLFLNIFPLPLFYKNVFLIIITALYALLSWNSISFHRALWLFLISKWGTLSRIPIQGLHSIVLISLWLIFYNPIQLFFIDFQLSFLLTFALMFYSLIQHTMRTLSPLVAHT